MAARLLVSLLEDLIGRRICHSRPLPAPPPRLGCSAALRCSSDGRTEQCGANRGAYAFCCGKTKPWSVLVASLVLAGLFATPFMELSWFSSLCAVTSGTDDAVAAF